MKQQVDKWAKKWSEIELQERNKILKKDFISLWPMIKTNVELRDNINESHSFDEDFDYTNRKIAPLHFWNRDTQ